jgi:hypothetical protein
MCVCVGFFYMTDFKNVKCITSWIQKDSKKFQIFLKLFESF